MFNDIKGFSAFEEIGLSIPNPRSCYSISGPAEEIERYLALAFQLELGLEIQGLTDEEVEKYRNFKFNNLTKEDIENFKKRLENSV